MIAAACQLLICMVVFTLVERLSPSSSPHRWWQRPLLIDVCSWLVVPLAVSAGLTSAVFLADALMADFPRHGLWMFLARMRSTVMGLSFPVQFACGFVILDFLLYWLHRAYHRSPLLWSFHILHHTSEHLDWLSTLRLHPVSQMLNTAITAVFLLLAGFSVQALIAANTIIGLSAVIAHANVRWTFGPFRHLLVSPVFHQWHHTRPDSPGAHHEGNFGAVLSVWDRIFGTINFPTTRPTHYGISEVSGANFRSLLVRPLRVLGMSLRQNRSDSR
jgi:sterol desaturase/sphingolipid hydroxylase (fatty acid hydroxylase superfamily)